MEYSQGNGRNEIDLSNYLMFGSDVELKKQFFYEKINQFLRLYYHDVK